MAGTKAVPLKRKSHTKPARRRTSPAHSVIGRDLKTALKAITTRQTRPLADVLKEVETELAHRDRSAV